MKYMFLIYSNEAAWTPEEWTKCTVDSSAICHELAARGQFVAASPLHPVQTATSVRVRDGRRLITDGPFAETTEQLGGYYIVDVPSLAEALAIAVRLPPAQKGTVEVRPIYEMPSIPVPGPNQIMSSRDLSFTPSQVYDAFAQPERLARWWGPAGFRNTVHEFDLRVGGHWRFTMHGPDGVDYPNHIVFESIDPPHRVVFRHEPPHFRMEISLAALPTGQTRVVWMMTFSDQATRDQVAPICVPANEQNFDRLTAELSGSR